MDPDTPLTDLGLDSLMAVELRAHLNRATGLQIPTKAIWQHPTITALADHLTHLLEDLT
ncbi:acyl carrier protein [Streptomyces sp. HJ7]